MVKCECILLLVAACLGIAAAVTPLKTVKVAWQPPGNRLDEMDRPRLLNCGDTLHLTCPPGETHGVFKIANVTGACPRAYTPATGDVLLKPTKDCDLKIKLNVGDNYFLTSQVPGQCQTLGMKMLVKVFCDAGATTTSQLKLGAGKQRAGNRTVSPYDSSDKAEPGEPHNGAGGRSGAAVMAALTVLGAAALLW